MSVRCKCGTYRRYGDEIEGRNIAPAMHLDACVNCGFVPNQSVHQQPVESEKPGLGDKVANVMETIGVKKVVDKISEKTGFDCGCERRRQKLNEFSRRFGKP